LVHKQTDSEHIVVVAIPFVTPSTKDEVAKAIEKMKADGLASKEAPSTFLQKRVGHKEMQLNGNDVDADADADAVSDAPFYMAPDNFDNIFDQMFMGHEPMPDALQSRLVEFPEAYDFVSPLLAGTPNAKRAHFFEYHGGLTAPPCTEQVTWMVRIEPLMISDGMAKRLHEKIFTLNKDYGNWRQPMPKMNRDIYMRRALPGDPPLKPAQYPTLMPLLALRDLLMYGPLYIPPPLGPPKLQEVPLDAEAVAKKAIHFADQSTEAADLISSSLTMAAPPLLGTNSGTQVTNPMQAHAVAAASNVRMDTQEMIKQYPIQQANAAEAARLGIGINNNIYDAAMSATTLAPLTPAPRWQDLMGAPTTTGPLLSQSLKPMTLGLVRMRQRLAHHQEPVQPPVMGMPSQDSSRRGRPEWLVNELVDPRPIWQQEQPWVRQPPPPPPRTTTTVPSAIEQLREVAVATTDEDEAANSYAAGADAELEEPLAHTASDDTNDRTYDFRDPSPAILEASSDDA
jgi:hypothetical protein